MGFYLPFPEKAPRNLLAVLPRAAVGHCALGFGLWALGFD